MTQGSVNDRAGGRSGPASTDYTAFLEFGEDREVRLRVLEQFEAWLREKRFDVDLRDNVLATCGDTELSVVHHRIHHGHDVLGSLVEPSNQGVWKTEVLLHVQERQRSWLRIKVSNDRGNFVAVPRLANYVMDVTDTFDGSAQFTSTPQVCRGGGAEELFHQLCDPERAAPIFAAGSDYSLPFDKWSHHVAKWTKQVRGLAHVFVLDPLATQALDELVGESHAVRPFTIRTYFPEVDPAVAADGLRHRVLGAKRLGKQDDSVTQAMFGRIAREAASLRVQPSSVARVERGLRRVADDYLLAQLQVASTDSAASPPVAIAADEETREAEVAEPSQVESSGAQDVLEWVNLEDATELVSVVEPGAPDTPTEAPAIDVEVTTAQFEKLQQQVYEYLSTVQMVKTVLGVERLDEEELRALTSLMEQARLRGPVLEKLRRAIDEKEATIAALEDDKRVLDVRVREAELDLAIAEGEKSALADERRWLRRRLQDLQDYDGAFLVVPEEEKTKYPDSFDELLERVNKPDFVAFGVVFCGDPDDARDIDEVDDWKRCVQTAWDALLALQGYVQARRDGVCQSGLARYLEQTPDGYRGMSPGKFAETETGVTMRDHGEERKFPVPKTVSPSGFSVMKSHFKLAKIGMVSPRMYILDRYTRDGCVYVGYIGAHLTNTQTN